MGQRSQKTRRGEEKLSARMTGVSPEQIAEAVERAQAAWDSDQLVHVYAPAALSALEFEGVEEALGAMLKMGWSLHSSAIGMQTVGPNHQQAVFVLIRP